MTLIAYSIFQVIEENVVHNYITLQPELTSVACSLSSLLNKSLKSFLSNLELQRGYQYVYIQFIKALLSNTIFIINLATARSICDHPLTIKGSIQQYPDFLFIFMPRIDHERKWIKQSVTLER